MLQSAITVAEARSCSVRPGIRRNGLFTNPPKRIMAANRERVREETDAAIASDHRHEQRAGGVHETDEEEAA
jgi:hypothetical protein